MEVEYQLTTEDLRAYQWRAAYASPNSRRVRRRAYVYLLLAFLLIAMLPAIGASGLFSIARINVLFLRAPAEAPLEESASTLEPRPPHTSVLARPGSERPSCTVLWPRRPTNRQATST
jgi:hypothetical protein